MTALHIATLTLAAILVIAAIGKLRENDDSTREEWEELGVPAVLNRAWLRLLHPFGEIALVVLALAPGPLSFIGAAGMLLLTLTYLVLIFAAWRKPEPVACACFGGAQRTALTGRTVVRNVLLVVLALCAVLATTVGEGSPWDVLVEGLRGPAAEVNGPLALLMGLLALAAGWLSAPVGTTGAPDATAAAAAAATVPAAATGPVVPSGAPASVEEEGDYLRTLTPRAPVVQADGTRTDLLALSSRGAMLLIFASFGCGPCRQVVADLAFIRQRLPMLDVRVVSSMAPDSLHQVSPEWREGALYDEDSMASMMLQVSGTPAAVLLGADGMLAGGPVLGIAAVRELIDDIEEALGEVAEPELDPAAPAG